MTDLVSIRHTVSGCSFDTTIRYSNLKLVGVGAYGQVCSATDNLLLSAVAIKKVPGPFQTLDLAKRTFREVKLLRHLRHDNVIAVRDIFVSPLDDLYLVTDLLSTDLACVIRLKPLDDQYAQYFFYQIMRALKYIHSAGVVHRDLKPGNILIDENCDLKICDFGLARTLDLSMTGYVTTRFYRAPETMLNWQNYGVGVDMWSAGCILAEMIEGEPLFPGRDHADQFLVISSLLGSIHPDVLPNICTESVSNYIAALPFREKVPLNDKLKNASLNALDILERLLVWSPSERISAATALSHPYSSLYHDPTDEPEAKAPFNWALIDSEHSVETWRTLIYEEIFDHFQCSLTETPYSVD